MLMTGIYVGKVDNIPNRDREYLPIQRDSKLWSIKYSIKGEGKGIAVCKALNSTQALIQLTSQGLYPREKYEILLVEEIIPSPDTMLIMEQVITYKEVSNE